MTLEHLEESEFKTHLLNLLSEFESKRVKNQPAVIKPKEPSLIKKFFFSEF